MKNLPIICLLMFALAACKKSDTTCISYDRSTISITQPAGTDSIFISQNQAVSPLADTRILFYYNGGQTASLSGSDEITWNNDPSGKLNAERISWPDIENGQSIKVDSISLYLHYAAKCGSGFVSGLDTVKVKF